MIILEIPSKFSDFRAHVLKFVFEEKIRKFYELIKWAENTLNMPELEFSNLENLDHLKNEVNFEKWLNWVSDFENSKHKDKMFPISFQISRTFWKAKHIFTPGFSSI